MFSSILLTILFAASCRNFSGDSSEQTEEEYFDDTEIEEDPNEEFDGTEEFFSEDEFSDEGIESEAQETESTETGLERYRDLVNEYAILVKAAGKNLTESTGKQIEGLLAQIKILEGALQNGEMTEDQAGLFESLRMKYESAVSEEVTEVEDKSKQALSNLKGALKALDAEEE